MNHLGLALDDATDTETAAYEARHEAERTAARLRATYQDARKRETGFTELIGHRHRWVLAELDAVHRDAEYWAALDATHALRTALTAPTAHAPRGGRT